MKNIWLQQNGRYVYYNEWEIPLILPSINAKFKDLAINYGLEVDESSMKLNYITCWDADVVEYVNITAPLLRKVPKANTFRYECVGEHTQKCPSSKMVYSALKKKAAFLKWKETLK